MGGGPLFGRAHCNVFPAHDGVGFVEDLDGAGNGGVGVLGDLEIDGGVSGVGNGETDILEGDVTALGRQGEIAGSNRTEQQGSTAGNDLGAAGEARLGSTVSIG